MVARFEWSGLMKSTKPQKFDCSDFWQGNTDLVQASVVEKPQIFTKCWA